MRTISYELPQIMHSSVNMPRALPISGIFVHHDTRGNILVVVVVCVYYKYKYCKCWTLVPPGGLQAYSLPQPWLCRAPKVRKGGEGGACVSMEIYNIKIHNIKHICPNSGPLLS